MNVSLRKAAFGFVALTAGAFMANAELTAEQQALPVVISQDFDWFSTPDADGHSLVDYPKPVTDPVAENYVGTVYQTAAQYTGKYPDSSRACYVQLEEDYGITLITANNPVVSPQAGRNCTYVAKNYLKFGKTSYQAGLQFAPIARDFKSEAIMSFDWTPHRQKTTDPLDKVKLAVVVTSFGVETEYPIEPLTEAADSEPMSWHHVDVVLPALKEGDVVAIRHASEQWPDPRIQLNEDGTPILDKNGNKQGIPLRYYLDNIVLRGEMEEAVAVTAPGLKQLWATHAGFGSANGMVRGGNAVNGKIYIVDGPNLTTVQNGKVDTVYVNESGANMNKSLFVDQAGNMLINPNFPIGAANWNQFRLISADGATVKDITLEVPEGSLFVGNRADMNGRAVGDFFSEQGGICFLTANASQVALPVLIKNGEFVPVEYTSEPICETAANTMATAVPAFSSMDEMDEEMFFNQYYFNSTAIQSWDIRGFNADGEAYTVPAPALDENGGVVLDPETGLRAYPTSQNGFDVVNLAGHNYYFRAYKEYDNNQHWGPDFLVNDENGNVVAYTHVFREDGSGWGTYNKTGNGNGLIVQKISDTEAYVYKIFANQTTDLAFCALYKFTVPARPLYMAGSHQGWNPAEATEFTVTPEGYTLDIESNDNVNFKLSNAKGSWDDFNAQLLGVQGGILEPNTLTDLVAGQDGDNTLPAGKYTITVSNDLKTIIANGEQYFTAPEFYLRGVFNDWGYSDATKFASDYTLNSNDEVVYTLALDALEGEVKIGNADWSVSLGGDNISIDGEGSYNLTPRSDAKNLNVAKMTNVKMTLTYPKSISKAPVLKVECDQFVARKAFAYDLKSVTNETGATLTFKLSADAEAADVYAIDADGNLTTIATLGKTLKGEECLVDVSDLANGTYTWGVEVKNNAEKTGYAYRAPIEWVDSDNSITGGVVSIRDTKEAAFGYTVVGMGKAHGYVVYNPAGELLTPEPAHKGYSKLTASNGSSTTRGDALKGYAVFADWSDGASGAWLVDPLNIETEPRNIFMVEGATQEGNGTIMYNGVATGSGSPTVAFQGEGEDTKMFMFDEDIYGNCLVRYDLGDATSVMAAPTLVMEGYKGKMLNTNIEVEAVENGFFVSQNRANSNDAGVPALMYFDNDGELVWDAGNKNLLSEDATTGISSGVAVNRAGDRIAISGYGKIYLFDLAFNAYDEPEFSNPVVFDTKIAYTGSRWWAQLTFDAADNLHVFDRMAGGYAVIVPAGESTSSVEAATELVINNTVGVENVEIDAQAEVEYFNLQGISVKAENLTPGVYVRRQGGVATKVIVK